MNFIKFLKEYFIFIDIIVTRRHYRDNFELNGRKITFKVIK